MRIENMQEQLIFTESISRRLTVKSSSIRLNILKRKNNELRKILYISRKSAH